MVSVLRYAAMIALMAVTLTVTSQAFAVESSEVETDGDLRRYVAENTEQLVEKLNRNRGLYEKDPEEFYAILESALTDFVDFRRIAARVMARYARLASPEQRDAFVKVFKRSLFESYAQLLVSSDEFRFDVKSAEIKEGGERALVNLEFTTSAGNQYPATYSMYRGKEGRWLMENVIVEGVNIGLAFRDRFSQRMEAEKGNIDAVIRNWVDVLKNIELDGEGEK
jgi:phospholipid transport system substrate-binding protein